ncbi:unnamed protein product [Withania somnifera]
MEPGANRWDFFYKIIDENGNCKAKCKYCEKLLSFATKNNGTSSMNNHMLRTCPKRPAIVQDNSQKLLNLVPFSKGAKDGVVSTWKFDQAQSRRALAQMVIVDELPFSFVEKEGFKNFMKVTVPQFHIPSRRTLIRDCYVLYGEQRKLLKKVFKEARPKICLTTDTWTSIQRISYMCLTTHFIDKNWTLHKRIINFYPVTSHKGVDMAASITKCLLDWGLDNVFTITVDNASSNDRGTNIMEGQHLHVRCMAHILNLIVQDGLKEIGKSIKRVRQAVKYIKQSPQRIAKFKECLGTKYVTNNVHLVEIAELDLILKEMTRKEDPNLKKMAENMRDKFRKYWGEPDKMNKMIFISSMLDPRNKLDYVPYAIVDMFGKEIGDKLCTCGRDIYESLVRSLSEDIEPSTYNFDILRWWKFNEPRFPILAEMARDVLAIPISSVASECAFSTGGRVLDPFRSSLTPKLVQCIICLQDWLRSESIPINIEEDLEYLEQLELDMASVGTESNIVDV